MADYFQINPQELDGDGELWKLLPSDIFPFDHQITSSTLNRPTYSCYNPHNYSLAQQQLSCMGFEDRLSQSLAALSFSQDSGLSPPSHGFGTPPPNLRRFRPAVQCVCCAGSLPVRCLVCNGCLSGTNRVRTGFRNEAFSTGDLPVYPCHFMNSNPNPVLYLAERFIEQQRLIRGFLERQRRSTANRVVENRFVPFSGGCGGNRIGHGTGDYGGTGVFLPRIPANGSSATSADRMNDHPKRRQGARSRHGEEDPRNSFMNMAQMKRQEDYLSQVSPDMGLPAEWTY
ncbi:unnamed protein product [Coffea canephora]|uniref:Uncharacterized protein n=1 Tax=Coffea canephora TaxID=49390 RepID=A0A068UQN1_COFCA|nr:unnamed protein product [Coffea canephora]